MNNWHLGDQNNVPTTSTTNELNQSGKHLNQMDNATQVNNGTSGFDHLLRVARSVEEDYGQANYSNFKKFAEN